MHFFVFFPFEFVSLFSLGQSRVERDSTPQKPNDAFCLRPQPGCRVRALDEREEELCCCGADGLAAIQCFSPPSLPGRRRQSSLVVRADRPDAARGLQHRPLALDAPRKQAEDLPVGGALGSGGEMRYGERERERERERARESERAEEKKKTIDVEFDGG